MSKKNKRRTIDELIVKQWDNVAKSVYSDICKCGHGIEFHDDLAECRPLDLCRCTRYREKGI